MNAMLGTMRLERFGMRARPTRERPRAETTVEEAARLAPEWGAVEARRLREPRPVMLDAFRLGL